MNKPMPKPLLQGLMASALALGIQAAHAEGEAQQIIDSTCVACHTKESDQSWSRISHMRKTPEGWLMTIARMQTMHGLKISDADRRTLVKYLADKQGLAPAETEGYRYALERRTNTHEEFDSQQFTEMCARCHSGARVKLQYRPQAEWDYLANFHLGQIPSLEYHALARDRDWWPIAQNEIVPMLGKEQPLATKAWSDWQQQPALPVSGHWTLAGHLPGKGQLMAEMTVVPAAGKDQYSLTLSGRFADGTPVSGSGSAIVYTGYEWRASLSLGDIEMRQVFALKDGELSGRMFDISDDSNGIDILGARTESGASQLLAVQPGYLKAGVDTELTLVGSNLQGTPNLGKGVRLLKVLDSSDNEIRVLARASAKAQGVQAVSVGSAGGASLAVYDKVAAVKVVPEFAVARIGGNGSSTKELPARFDAEAWSAGKDGKAGTADDFRIGVMPATWKVAPFDAQAEEDQDVKFAGVMQTSSGIFTPAGAGPNPERKMMTNNAGHLKVIADVADAGQTHSAEAELIVTVQRWNNPPIP